MVWNWNSNQDSDFVRRDADSVSELIHLCQRGLSDIQVQVSHLSLYQSCPEGFSLGSSFPVYNSLGLQDIILYFIPILFVF